MRVTPKGKLREDMAGDGTQPSGHETGSDLPATGYVGSWMRV
jgi:hypothetical protein